MAETTASPDHQLEEETGQPRRRRARYRVKGDKLTGKIRELMHEGNVRHVVIKNEKGRTLIEFPVTLGVAGAILAPVWAAVGAIAAMVANLSIEVEREEGADAESD